MHNISMATTTTVGTRYCIGCADLLCLLTHFRQYYIQHAVRRTQLTNVDLFKAFQGRGAPAWHEADVGPPRDARSQACTATQLF